MRASGLLRAMPFLGLAVLAYILGVIAIGLPLDQQIFAFSLPSGAVLRFLFSDLILFLGLVFFFIELIMSTRPTQTSLINHGFSMALFIVCGLLFLLVAKCGTMTFFLLTMLTLIDVVSGYSISIITARRDLTVEKQL